MFPSVPQNTQPLELHPTVMALGFPSVWHLQDSRCESLGTQYNLFTLLVRFSYLCLISPTKLKASRSQIITLNSLHSFLNILRHHNLFLKIILSVTQSEPFWLEEGWQDPKCYLRLAFRKNPCPLCLLQS